MRAFRFSARIVSSLIRSSTKKVHEISGSGTYPWRAWPARTSEARAGATPETFAMRRTLLALAVSASMLNPGLLDPIADLLSSIWSASESADAGCIWDPDGRCRPAPQLQLDEGCGMDPYGCPKGS